MCCERVDNILIMKKKMYVSSVLVIFGLPTAAILANRGFNVAGVDINPEIISTLSDGKIHIVEDDLEASVKSSISNGQLKVLIKYRKVMFI